MVKELHVDFRFHPSTSADFVALCHLTSSFVLVIISTATTGHHLTVVVNMGHDKLLGQVTYAAVLLMRTGWACHPSSEFLRGQVEKEGRKIPK